MKSIELAKHQNYLLKIHNAFCSVSFNYLSRSKNQFVDALATLSSVLRISKKTKLRPIAVETQAILCTAIIESELDGIRGIVTSRNS